MSIDWTDQAVDAALVIVNEGLDVDLECGRCQMRAALDAAVKAQGLDATLCDGFKIDKDGRLYRDDGSLAGEDIQLLARNMERSGMLFCLRLLSKTKVKLEYGKLTFVINDLLGCMCPGTVESSLERIGEQIDKIMKEEIKRAATKEPPK